MIPRGWWTVVAGVAIGVALFVMRVSPQSALAAQAFYLVFLPLVIIPLHELGHAAAGALVGMRIVGITIGNGPTLFATQLLGVKVRINLVPFMGVTLGLPKRAYSSLRWRRWIFTAGGPAANVLIYFGLRRLFGPALHDFKHHPLIWTAGWANLSLLAINLFPFHTKDGLASDGHGLLTIPFWSKQRCAEEHTRAAASRVAHAIVEGDLDTAGRLAEELRLADPESPHTAMVLGSLAHAQHRHEAARDLFRQGLAKLTEPRLMAMAKNNIAFMHVMLGREDDLPEADQLSGEAITFLPDVPSLAGTRGAVLLRLGRVGEALPLLQASEAGAETKHNLAYAKAFVACALASSGRHDDARRKLAEAREADPQCDLLPRAEADVAAAMAAPPVAASPDAGSRPIDDAQRAAALRRWQRDARIVAFVALVLMSDRFGSIPPALLAVVLTLSFVPERSGGLALATAAFWTAGLFVFGFIRDDVTSPRPAGAVPVALAIAAAACWLVARHRRLGPPPPSRVPTVLGWVLAGFGILFALPALLGLQWHRSGLSVAGTARDFVVPSLLLVALVPIVATRRRAIRWLAVLPGAVAVLTLIGASDLFLNRVALAATQPEGTPIVWSPPVPARALRSRTIATRGRQATLSPTGTAFFIKREEWFGLGGLTVADFESRLVDVAGAAAAFLDDDRLLVVRGPEGKKKGPATLAEVHLSAGPTPVWTKPLPDLSVYSATIEIDRRTGHVYVLNNDPDDGQALVFRTTADATTPIEPIQAPHPGADELLAHGFGPAGWNGMFVAKRGRGTRDVWWRAAGGDKRLGSGVPALDCPHRPLGALVLWCLGSDVPILFKVDPTVGTVTRVPGELPYDWSDGMLGPSRLAVLGHDEVSVIDLDTRRGTRLTLPENEGGKRMRLARGGLATLASDGDKTSTVVAYAEPPPPTAALPSTESSLDLRGVGSSNDTCQRLGRDGQTNVFIARSTLDYCEGKRGLPFYWEPKDRKGDVCILDVPSATRWPTEFPAWAHGRRDEILANIKRITTERGWNFVFREY